jgi:hypothetical protein
MKMAPQAGFEPATLRLTETPDLTWVSMASLLGRFSDCHPSSASVRFVGDTYAVSHCVSPDLAEVPVEDPRQYDACRPATASHLQLVFYVFDLLHVDGRDFTKHRLHERHAALASIDLTAPLLWSEPLPGSVSAIEAARRRTAQVQTKRHLTRGADFTSSYLGMAL